VERVGPCELDRLLALGGAVVDVENRRVEAAIGSEDADETLDDARLLRQAAEQEHVSGGSEEEDERQHKPEEQETRERILAAEAGDLQLGDGVLVGESPPKVEPVDDGAHAERLLLAQALAAAVGLGG